MKDLDEHKKIAVLIDADNTQHSKLELILDEISVHGHMVIKRAYGDWSNEYLKNWKPVLNELAIQPIQQFAYTHGKNATDSHMIIDAMDLLYSKKFDAFAIVSSDSDFTRLVSRLRESEIFVFGVGKKQTPVAFRNACDDFIFTENLGLSDNNSIDNNSINTVQDVNGVKELVPVLMKAWSMFQDDSGWVNVAPVGAFLKRLKPDFDPRSYGVPTLVGVIGLLSDDFEMKRYKGKGTVNIVAYKPKKNQ